MAAKGEGIIKLNANGFKSSVDGVKKGFGDIDRSATSAFNNVKNKANDASNAVRKTGDTAIQTGEKLKNMSVQVIGLGQAVNGATAAWSSYHEQIVALNKQRISAEKLTVQTQRAEEDLAKAINEGKLSIEELTRKTEDLNFMRREQALALEEISAKEKTLQTQLVSLGFNMVQTGFFGITTLTTVLSTNQKAWIAAKLATIGFSKASIAAAFSMGTLRAAMTAVSSHPLMTIALVTAAAAMAAYESNILGFRDALSGLAGTELPTISESLSNLTGSILPDASAQTDKLTESLQASQKMLEGYEQKVDDTTGALDAFGNAIEKTKNSGDSLTGSSAAAQWAKYWGDRYDEILKAENALRGFNAEVVKLKSTGFSPAVIKAAITSQPGETSLALARTQALQKQIIAANLAGIGGGNAFTLANSLNARNITGSNKSILAAINTFRNFGVNSSFASSFGGGAAVSTFGTSRSDFGRPSGASFSQSGTSAHRTASGKSSKHGASNLTVKFNLYAEERRINNQLLGATGLSLQELQSITGLDLFNEDVYGAAGRTALSGNFGSYTRYQAAQVARGQLQAAREKQAQANRNEVNLRVALINQIRALNPSLNPSLTSSSATLKLMLQQQESQIASFSEKLNLTRNEIITLQQSQTGRFDITGMLRFKERTSREVMAATTV